MCIFAYDDFSACVKIKVACFNLQCPMACDDRHFCIFAFYLRIRAGEVFILCPGLNLQLTPVVTAKRHFHFTRFPCGSIRNIRFAYFDFENDEGRGPTLTNVVVLKLHLVE